MKTIQFACIILLVACTTTHAQLGTISIPTGAEITVPIGAILCADTIFANNPGFGTLTYPNSNAICRAVVIPVELLSLSASYKNNTVALLWKVLHEQNCAGYEVQRASVDEHWQTVGFSPATSDRREEKSYTYVDRLSNDIQSNELLRYRLRLIDNDGSFDYSPVLEVQLAGVTGSVELCAPYPNPAADRLQIPFSLSGTSNVSIAIFNIAGEEVMRLRTGEPMPPGSHLVTANLEHLQNGTYIIELRVEGSRMTQTIVVRR